MGEVKAANAWAPSDVADTFRVFGVGLSALLVLAFAFPIVFLGFRDHGFAGLKVSATGVVSAVVPGSPAAVAGVRARDVLDRAALSPRDRLLLRQEREFVPVGTRFVLPVERDGRVVQIAVQTLRVRSTMTMAGKVLVILEYLVFAVYVIVGAIVFALRPGWMTFFLYAFCISTMPDVDVVRAYTWVSEPWYGPMYVGMATLVDGITPVPLLPFVLRFPHDRLEGWRARIWPAVLTFVTVGLLYWFIYEFRLVYDPAWNPVIWLDYDVPIFGTYAIAVAILVANYATAPQPDRERIKYAVVGMSTALGALTLAYVDSSTSTVSFAIIRLLYVLSVVFPISVAYAILRQRLVDVNFALNRAVVFGIMTSVLVIAIGLLDWAIGNTISSAHWAIALDAAVSVGIGLVLDRIYDRVVDFVERTMFRARHAAERYLERVARSLPFAVEPGVIDEALTDDAADALRLASAAVFRRDEQNACYVRMRAVGWDAAGLQKLDLNDDLIRFLESDARPIQIGEARWHRAGLPTGTHAPVFALPIVVRHMVIAVALYGGHRNGTTIDPSEISLLDRLGAFAANAYDSVDTLVLERTIAALRQRNAALEAVAGGHVGSVPVDTEVLLPSVHRAAAARKVAPKPT